MYDSCGVISTEYQKLLEGVSGTECRIRPYQTCLDNFQLVRRSLMQLSTYKILTTRPWVERTDLSITLSDADIYVKNVRVETFYACS